MVWARRYIGPTLLSTALWALSCGESGSATETDSRLQSEDILQSQDQDLRDVVSEVDFPLRAALRPVSPPSPPLGRAGTARGWAAGRSRGGQVDLENPEVHHAPRSHPEVPPAARRAESVCRAVPDPNAPQAQGRLGPPLHLVLLIRFLPPLGLGARTCPQRRHPPQRPCHIQWELEVSERST